jgi:hypothetical protein
MLPPVLEVYVVWHPKDAAGSDIANEITGHFRGTAFSGLIGGAVEVFSRSVGWSSEHDSPRPIPFPNAPLAPQVKPAHYTAIVPILGLEMARAVETGGAWSKYVQDIAAGHYANMARVGVFPYRLDQQATNGTALGAALGNFQTIAAARPDTPYDTATNLRCRDLSQAIAQCMSGDNTRIIAFISHTKHSGAGEPGDVAALVKLVRDVVASTHLREFFDARDLQPGTDWVDALIENAANCALLAVRTDLYPSRDWCQQEILTAKRHGMPVVTLDALGRAEERGSFLMDHVPRVPARYDGTYWRRTDVYISLNILVDECLKRAIWRVQQTLAAGRPDLQVNWWAPHAPEPTTLAQWLEEAKRNHALPNAGEALRILHPDPPLGAAEKAVLEQMLSFGGLAGRLDVMTPRQLAARGG